MNELHPPPCRTLQGFIASTRHIVIDKDTMNNIPTEPIEPATPAAPSKALPKMSTGEDATLGNYLKLCTRVFGGESRAVEYLQKMIEKDPNKENGAVLQEEDQTLVLLAHLHTCGLMDCADGASC